MIRNDVFVQRGIRAVKLWQLSVGAFLRINTVVILLGDVIKGNPWVVQAEMEGCKIWKKFVGAWGIKSSRYTMHFTHALCIIYYNEDSKSLCFKCPCSRASIFCFLFEKCAKLTTYFQYHEFSCHYINYTLYATSTNACLSTPNIKMNMHFLPIC